jgi:hypothetical protein
MSDELPPLPISARINALGDKLQSAARAAETYEKAYRDEKRRAEDAEQRIKEMREKWGAEVLHLTGEIQKARASEKEMERLWLGDVKRDFVKVADVFHKPPERGIVVDDWSLLKDGDKLYRIA